MKVYEVLSTLVCPHLWNRRRAVGQLQPREAQTFYMTRSGEGKCQYTEHHSHYALEMQQSWYPWREPVKASVNEYTEHHSHYAQEMQQSCWNGHQSCMSSHVCSNSPQCVFNTILYNSIFVLLWKTQNEWLEYICMPWIDERMTPTSSKLQDVRV
jgi:hypothetical protein